MPDVTQDLPQIALDFLFGNMLGGNEAAPIKKDNSVTNVPVQSVPDMVDKVTADTTGTIPTAGTVSDRPAPIQLESTPSFMDILKQEVTKMPEPAHYDLLDGLMEQLYKHEGKMGQTYSDSGGNPTVGVGFNLGRSDAKELLAKVGADYQSVKAGRARLDDQQIKSLTQILAKEAMDVAAELVPGYTTMSPGRQTALADMAYNLGRTKFSEFTNFFDKLREGDFVSAAKDLTHTKWWTQVGTARRNKIYNQILTGEV